MLRDWLTYEAPHLLAAFLRSVQRTVTALVACVLVYTLVQLAS